MGVNQVLEAWDDERMLWTMKGMNPWSCVRTEGPPKLSEAELAEVEKKAGKDEIVKLMERLNVIRPATDEEVNSGKILDTRTVWDWRFRSDQ